MKKKIISISTSLVLCLTLFNIAPVGNDTYASENSSSNVDSSLFFSCSERKTFNGHTYQIIDRNMNWTRAKAYCESLGGHLVSINSKEEQTFLTSIIRNNETSGGYIIGLYYDYNDDIWKWADGSLLTYTNWNRYERNGEIISMPDNWNGEEYYGHMFTSKTVHSDWISYKGMWNDAEDYVEPFICEWDYEGVDVEFEMPTYNGHSYYVFSDVCDTWEDAKRFCENRGGYLAVINDQKENDALYKLMMDFGYESAYFGYTDKEEENLWKWVSNDNSSYENFNKVEEIGDIEPNGDTSENYAMFYFKYNDGSWNDGDFGVFTENSGKAFICEWDYTNFTSYQSNDGNYTLHYTTNLGREHRSANFTRIYDIDSIATERFTKYYQPDLAYILSIMAASAYTQGDVIYNLNTLGFTNYSLYNYYDNPVDERYEEDGCAFSIAKKELSNNNTLVLITIRGSYGGFENGNLLNEHSDWYSNLTIWFPELAGFGTHQGFDAAKDKVFEQLKEVLGGDLLKTNVKYMITGHSRGAGIANLLAKEIRDEGVSIYDIFNYNFACPDVAKKNFLKWNSNGKYDNIFNIGVAGDPVSVVPGVLGSALSSNHNILSGTYGVQDWKKYVITQWGKYGKSYWFSDNWSDESIMYDPDLHASENYVRMLSNQKDIGNAKTWAQMQRKKVRNSGKEIIIKTISAIPLLSGLSATISDTSGKPIAIINGSEIEYKTTENIEIKVNEYEDQTSISVNGKSDVVVEFSGIDDSNVELLVVSSSDNPNESETIAYYEVVPLSNDATQFSVSDKDNITISNKSNSDFNTLEPVYYIPSYLYGDINSDNSFNIADVVSFQSYLLGRTSDIENWRAADLCEDARLDVFDLCLMRRKLIYG